MRALAGSVTRSTSGTDAAAGAGTDAPPEPGPLEYGPILALDAPNRQLTLGSRMSFGPDQGGLHQQLWIGIVHHLLGGTNWRSANLGRPALLAGNGDRRRRHTTLLLLGLGLISGVQAPVRPV